MHAHTLQFISVARLAIIKPSPLTTGAFFKGGGPANEIIGLGILEAPKSPKTRLGHFAVKRMGRPPPLLPKLQNWPPGRIVAEGRIVIAIGGSLLSLPK